MKAIILEKYESNLSDLLKSLTVKEIDKPVPDYGQVLIKVDGSPCNPSDIAFMRGMYAVKKTLPKVPGFEGTGTVVECGASSEALALLHKRVSCFTQGDEHGPWAEFFITSAKNCIPVSDKMPAEQAACFFVNPFTAYGLFETALKMQAEAIVQNAAAGQVGRFIRTLAKNEGIPLINIVRRPQHVEMLRNESEKHVLNMRDRNFAEDLKELCHQLNANVVFDAVGGDHSGLLINSMPDNASLILYGGLSGKSLEGIEILGMIFNKKAIRGFNLGNWLETVSGDKLREITAALEQLILSGTCESKIQRVIGLNEVYDGLYHYLTHMSDGKVILNPQKNNG